MNPVAARRGHHRLWCVSAITDMSRSSSTTCKTSSRTFLAATSSVTTMGFMFYTRALRGPRVPWPPKPWVGPSPCTPLAPPPNSHHGRNQLRERAVQAPEMSIAPGIVLIRPGGRERRPAAVGPRTVPPSAIFSRDKRPLASFERLRPTVR